jgi:pyruvate dehydrogenase E2 component (dihydrolipoamide acetyltransferase)/2-oxoisovalerate dehydrogenase E2 component (dihydrolipoyl transacylase)
MDFHLPELGEGVYEAEMSRWLVREGDTVKPGQGLLEMLTDKATMEVPAPFAGTIEALRVKEGQKVKVGDIVLTFREKNVAEKRAVATPPLAPAAVATTAPLVSGPVPGNAVPGNGAREPVRAAPSVRVLARELGIDISQVPGSGPRGRVLIDDLQPFLKAGGAPEAPAVPPAYYGTPGTRIKLQGVRRAIAEHMVAAKRTIPHYTYVDEVDVSELVRIRDGLRSAAAPRGAKLTYLPFFAKAVIRALKEVPMVNASLDEAAGEILLHERYHIGIAVATAAGLVVPVVHDADRLSFLDLAREIERLSAAARAGKARREDLLGGTFTVTSIGNIGGLFATPIIHHPQVGILGVGKITRRPVYDANQQVQPADMVYLSYSFDHRVLDGAVGAVFGNAVAKYLTNPVALLVE